MGLHTDAFRYLNSSELVAEIQGFFSIEIKPEQANKKAELEVSNCENERKKSAEPSEKEKKAKLMADITASNSGYSIQNRFWYILFRVFSGFGDEIFYATMIPFWFWNIDGAVGRRIVAIWALSMYIGQSLKDVIQWPRPHCPPAARLITKQVAEYGMPSTHALVAAMVPAAMLFFTSNRYEYRAWIGVIVSIVWCLLICISRIYLGMHSVLDVIAGLALSGILLPILLPFVDFLDPFFLSHPASPIVLLVTTITMVKLAPDSVAVTTKEDTTVVVGSAVGILIGSWFCFVSGHVHGPPVTPPYTILWPSTTQLLTMVVRMVIGLALIALTRYYGKLWSMQLMKNILQWYKKQDLSHPDQEQFVRLGYKYLTYSLLGLSTSFAIPVLFKLMGIERPNFHTEV